MVMRFFYGSPIEDDIGRLTAEDVPSHELDIAEALNFADKVRSKEYGAKDVAHALRSRLEYPNPNVQILALSLTDICVKNGGHLIQLELARREFIDAVVGLLESKTGRDHELRQLILRLVQEWAALFRGNSEMGYVGGVMERMKRTGHSFPRLSAPASSAMVDTATAPEWVDSPVCQRCRTAFTLTNRKHHCRNCGMCFCNDCSSNNTPIPRFAYYDQVRVCHGCYLRLKKIVPDAEGSDDTRRRSDSRPSPLRAPASGDDEDENLKRAIELSLQEAQKRPNYAEYTLKGVADAPAAPAISAQAPPPAVAAPPAHATITRTSTTQYPAVSSEPYPLTSAPSNAPAAAADDEEDDPDLRAAIEASLRDMPGAGAVPDYMQPADNSRFAPAQAHASADAFEDDAPLSAFMPAVAVSDEDDGSPLSVAERENVQLFDALLTRIRDGGQDIRFDPQVQYLRESIQQLHPRITGAIESVDQKHREFIKLHDRIVTAIKIYDQLLDKRLRSSTYVGASPSPAAAPPHLQSLYPAVPAHQAVFGSAAQSQYPLSTNPPFYQHDSAPPAAYAPRPEQHSATDPHFLPGQQPMISSQPALSDMHAPGTADYTAAPSHPSAALAQHTGTSAPGMRTLSAGAYAVPPPISHVPSIPALQPTAKTHAAQASPLAASAPAASAPILAPATQPQSEPEPEPEEALLIEF
ncbi:Vacuolar protein-sorting-associated protein 27 [Coemansia biformis]|uniref:Vacuolar protein sorting-associated protein 27 n=1 Tax=Coemansia biformis TaxID=1286918 RepID=A0A9W7Y9S8_9FUNG|nr:Vacuolar protein-sorting-associated protein 27 [Coemansia biformis]